MTKFIDVASNTNISTTSDMKDALKNAPIIKFSKNIEKMKTVEPKAIVLLFRKI